MNRHIRKLLIRAGLIKGTGKPMGLYRIHQRSKAEDSQIGDFTYISADTHIRSAVIGKFCSIGPNTVIGYGEHPLNFLSTSPVFYHTGLIFAETFATEEKFEVNKQVMIGNDVWIGANVFVKSGITIGDGCVIAAGAVVIKDIPPYSIAGGVPARIIRSRFPEEVTLALTKIKWWNWPVEKLKENHAFFVADDLNLIRQFIRKHHAD